MTRLFADVVAIHAAAFDHELVAISSIDIHALCDMEHPIPASFRMNNILKDMIKVVNSSTFHPWYLASGPDAVKAAKDRGMVVLEIK